MTLKRVVLPAPLGPINPVTSPFPTTNDTASVLGAYMSVIGQLKDSIGGYSQSALAAVQSAEAQASSFAELANGLRGVANRAQQLMAADINFDGLTGEIAAARAALQACASTWRALCASRATKGSNPAARSAPTAS